MALFLPLLYHYGFSIHFLSLFLFNCLERGQAEGGTRSLRGGVARGHWVHTISRHDTKRGAPFCRGYYKIDIVSVPWLAVCQPQHKWEEGDVLSTCSSLSHQSSAMPLVSSRPLIIQRIQTKRTVQALARAHPSLETTPNAMREDGRKHGVCYSSLYAMLASPAQPVMI